MIFYFIFSIDLNVVFKGNNEDKNYDKRESFNLPNLASSFTAEVVFKKRTGTPFCNMIENESTYKSKRSIVIGEKYCYFLITKGHALEYNTCVSIARQVSRL